MRWPDIGLAVVLGLASLVGALGAAVYAPRQMTPAAVAPAAAILLVSLAYLTLAGVIVAVSLGRQIPGGEVVFSSDGGAVTLALAVLPLGIAPILLGVAVEGLTRGHRGTLGAVFLGLLGLAFAAGGWALASTRTEVRVGLVNGEWRIILIDGRGFPGVTTANAAAAHLEIVPVQTSRNKSWKIMLVDADGRQRVVGRAWTEADARAQVTKLNGG